MDGEIKKEKSFRISALLNNQEKETWLKAKSKLQKIIGIENISDRMVISVLAKNFSE